MAEMLQTCNLFEDSELVQSRGRVEGKVGLGKAGGRTDWAERRPDWGAGAGSW